MFLEESDKQENLKEWPRDLKFTTEVSIVPNTFPFPDCHGNSCGDKMV